MADEACELRATVARLQAAMAALAPSGEAREGRAGARRARASERRLAALLTLNEGQARLLEREVGHAAEVEYLLRQQRRKTSDMEKQLQASKIEARACEAEVQLSAKAARVALLEREKAALEAALLETRTALEQQRADRAEALARRDEALEGRRDAHLRLARLEEVVRMLQQENDSLRKDAAWDRRGGAFHVCSPRHLDSAGGSGSGVGGGGSGGSGGSGSGSMAPGAGAAPVLISSASGLASESQPAKECASPSRHLLSASPECSGVGSLPSPRSRSANARSEQLEEERKADDDESGKKEIASESCLDGDGLRHKNKRNVRCRECSSPPVPSLSAASIRGEWAAKIFIPIAPPVAGANAHAHLRGASPDFAWG
jgi:hypothetical protein